MVGGGGGEVVAVFGFLEYGDFALRGLADVGAVFVVIIVIVVVINAAFDGVESFAECVGQRDGVFLSEGLDEDVVFAAYLCVVGGFGVDVGGGLAQQVVLKLFGFMVGLVIGECACDDGQRQEHQYQGDADTDLQGLFEGLDEVMHSVFGEAVLGFVIVD